jgi:hypothetical protein
LLWVSTMYLYSLRSRALSCSSRLMFTGPYPTGRHKDKREL